MKMKDDEQLLLEPCTHHPPMIRHSSVSRKNQAFIGLCLFGCIFMLVFVNEKYGNPVYFKSYSLLAEITELDELQQTKKKELFNFSNESSKAKHFYTDISHICYGLGNMIFRIASFYGIGKQIHRLPCLQGKCAVKYQPELHSAFPMLTNFPLREKCWNEKDYNVNFADKDPRGYENITKLALLEDIPNLRIKTSYLQQVKYFDDLRFEIKEIFKFSDKMNERVDKYANNLFNETNPTKKVCMHMRRTDFLSNRKLPLMASLIEFTVPALFYVTELARNETDNDISILLFCDDPKFSKSVVKGYKVFNNNTTIYIPDKLERLEYMNLASRYCDYYIVTASGSTYAWWTAYLMDDDKQNKVFYNSRIFRPHRKDSAKNFVEDYFFPQKWRRLVLDKNTSTVFEQDRKTVPLVSI